MSKNTTKLRKQLRVIIEDTCEEQIRLLEKLISNREKLARIDELEKIYCCDVYPINKKEKINVCSGKHQDRIADLRKELDGEQR